MSDEGRTRLGVCTVPAYVLQVPGTLGAAVLLLGVPALRARQGFTKRAHVLVVFIVSIPLLSGTLNMALACLASPAQACLTRMYPVALMFSVAKPASFKEQAVVGRNGCLQSAGAGGGISMGLNRTEIFSLWGQTCCSVC